MDDRELLTLSRTLLTSPARDVTYGSAQTSFFNLAVGGQVGVVSTSDDTLVWDTLRETVRSGPQSGKLAIRPDGRVYVAADSVDGLSVYDLAAGDANAPLTALTVFSVNDQSVPIIEFSPDGSLLAEARRGWVTLWDMRDPSSPRRVAEVAPHGRRPDRAGRPQRRSRRRFGQQRPAQRLGRARRRILAHRGPGAERDRGPAPRRGPRRHARC